MVWGPGTFGYSPEQLAAFKSEECPGINLDKIKFDTINHGEPGGDNFMEGSLDVSMISSFGMNASLLVSNTNASMSTEEGDGFGLAFLDHQDGGLAFAELEELVIDQRVGDIEHVERDLGVTVNIRKAEALQVLIKGGRSDLPRPEDGDGWAFPHWRASLGRLVVVDWAVATI